MKKFLKALVIILIITIIIAVCLWMYCYFTGMNIATLFSKKSNITSNTNLVIDNDIENDIQNAEISAIFNLSNYPKIDGSTATIPLSKAFKKAFTGDSTATVTHNTTHNAYVNLINGDTDLILVTEPSAEEKELADSKNFELEVTPSSK